MLKKLQLERERFRGSVKIVKVVECSIYNQLVLGIQLHDPNGAVRILQSDLHLVILKLFGCLNWQLCVFEIVLGRTHIRNPKFKWY